MTAEVVVMNRMAVALAADSASTIALRRKVFNSAEKLFMLIPRHPVGFMIYNDSEFMQLPWETIVKKYRDAFGNSPFKTLKEYSEDFISFLSNPNNALFSDQQLEVSFKEVVAYYFVEIRRKIATSVYKRTQDEAKPISLDEINEITGRWRNMYHDRWNNYKNHYSDEVVEELLTGLRKYHDVIERVRDEVFAKLPLSDENKERLETFCYFLFYKDHLTDFYTGIVFAGFGEADAYPTCIEYVVENCFNGHLKYHMRRELGIDPNIIGRVIPFAQIKEVINILYGIHPDFEEQLEDELNGVFSALSVKEVIDAMKGLKKKRKERIMSALDKLKKDKQNNVLKKVQDIFSENHTDSILQTVSMLPKDELANMAESLVNITSFVRKVSMDIESVGGPIDVAVISRKDGFVWIKRKHYFDAKYNPHFNYSTGGAR